MAERWAKGEKKSLLHDNDTASPDQQTGVKNTEMSSSDTRKCKVYKRRWYVLFIFAITSIVSNMMWNTWGPIQRPCRLVFGWEKWTVLLLSSLGGIGPIMGAFPSTWLMDTKGLRLSVQVTSVMLLFGKAVQVIPFHNLLLRTIVIYIGHLITMLLSFIPNGAPPLVSATWFPPNERTTATAIGTLAASIGAALAFFIGPTMMPKTVDISEGNKHNLTDKDVKLLEARLMDYFYVQIGIAAFLFLCVTIYFPSKPPLPPSITQSTRKQTRIGYVEGIKMLVTNWSYWLLIFVFAASFGIYFGWMSVLDLAVQPFKVDEETSGLLGTSGNLAGIVSGIIIARSADIVKHRTKEILVGLYIGTVMMQLIFTLTCSKILPFSHNLLFASIICSGLLFNSTFPLLFELIIECVYPVGEGTAAGIGLVLGNVVIFVFDAAFMFPMSNVEWMNWVSVGGIAICIPLLLAYKSQNRRLDLDTS